jgi:hypothetical protein
MENDVLEQRVIVDSPGTGDPSVLEEMVRDFLPICDRLIYTFSAAIPLDKTDLPILEKAKKDLPFIPMAFVVTRADEFRQDPLRPLSEDNFDRARADMFVSELIARLANAVKELTITQEDILILDNVTGFNTERLADFVFRASEPRQDAATVLHVHKIAYYARSAKRIRDFFVAYLKQKMTALDMLLTTARENQSHYQEAVTMANSRLAESWREKNRELMAKPTEETEWVMQLETCSDLPATMFEASPLVQGMENIREAIQFWADSAARTACRSLKGKLSAQFHLHMSSLHDLVVRSRKPDRVPLQPFIVHNPSKAGLLNLEVDAPLAIVNEIRRIPDKTADFMRERAATIAESAKRLGRSISDRRLVGTMENTLEESIQQLHEMLDAFFQSVQLYRTGILALNARELAEKVGVAQAIDAVERGEILEDKRKSWLTVTVERVFPKRNALLERCEKKLLEISDNLAAVNNEAKRLSVIEITGGLSPNVEEEAVALSQLARDNEVLQAVQGAVDSFNEASSSLFEALNDKREMLLSEPRTVLKQRIGTVIRRRLRRLCRYATIGSIVGLLSYLAVVFSRQPVQQNVTAVVLVGVLANACFAFVSWSIGWLTDTTRVKIEEETTQHARVSRAITEQLLKDNRHISDWGFIDDLRPIIRTVISARWSCAAEEFLKSNVVGPLQKAYERLTSISSVLDAARDDYIGAADELASSLSAFYQRTDQNLEALAEVSAQIRKQAIEPSFSMLQECSDALRRKHEDLQGLDFSW